MKQLPFLLRRASWLACLVLFSTRLSADEPAATPATNPASPAKLQPVSLGLLWNHQSQFAGYYMALEKGFYRREGLDLTIRRGGADVSPADDLIAGKTDFCVAMLATALERRSKGIPLKLLSQIVNRSNFVLVAWKHPPSSPEATISQLADLKDRPVSLWEKDLRLPFLACFDTQKIQPKILPQYYTLSLFLRHGVDACSAMRYNEYHRMMQHGVKSEDVVVFNLWEHGVVLPEDGLYALDKTWETNSERCRAFVRASLDGWRYAQEHREETLDVVMRYIDADNLPTNRPHMRWMLKEILDSIFPEAGDPWFLGQLTPSAYAEALRLMQRRGVIQTAPSFEETAIMEARHANP